MLETNPALPPGVLVSWGLVGPSGRGRRPTVEVAGIVAAAIAVADADGLTAVSMPRVARRVGLTQNALYRHVASKEELLVLLADAANGEPPHLSENAGWRANARAWVTTVIDRYLAHPWLLDIRLRAPVTRNTVRWTEAFLRATRDSGLAVDQRLQWALLLDGHARHTAAIARDLADAEPVYSDALVALLTPLLQRDGCTEFAAFLSGAASPAGGSGSPAGPEADFGLERILDGIAAFIARQQDR